MTQYKMEMVREWWCKFNSNSEGLRCRGIENLEKSAEVEVTELPGRGVTEGSLNSFFKCRESHRVSGVID